MTRKQKNFFQVVLLVVYLTGGSFQLTAQLAKKKVIAERVNDAPKIDALLGDSAWKNAPAATDFYQFIPYNGKPATYKSEVKFVYDNMAIYVGAMLYDPRPDSIYTELSQRDEISMVDYFGVYFDCFNDNLAAFGFFVTASGVQVDMKSGQSFGEDGSWDAVWQSEIKICDSGWIAEFKIPWSALRFPKTEKQVWGLQIFRNIMRYRENTTWNFINREVDGINNQAGELHGIENIDPPLRLSFVPYIAGYLEKSPEIKSWGYSYNYGLDLKFGINESYTLDMTLIPDFGQVQSDDKVYNLTPFEIYYDEKRPFFMEGTELFNKGNIFYSRRLGSKPSGHDAVADDIASTEIINKNPLEANLINATKISGKNKKNLALGIFNGMTANTYADVSDTVTGISRRILTEPFTNFNMFVLDQALKNNSFVSLFNTNVYKPSNEYSANVTGAEIRLADKSNKYFIYGEGIVSQKYKVQVHPGFGYKYMLIAGKMSGNFTSYGSHDLISDKYDQNDMGYLERNNYIADHLTLGYNIYEPVWKILDWFNELSLSYEQQYFPRKYVGLYIKYETHSTFKNHLTAWFDGMISPLPTNDYFEPRVKGWYFERPPHFYFNTGFSPDYRHRFVVDTDFGIKYSKGFDQFNYWLSLEPRFRVNDKLMFVLEFAGDNDKNNFGHVKHYGGSNNDSSIIFGSRDIITIENSLQANYRFTNKSSLDFRLRHYWITIKYNEFFVLQENGGLLHSSYSENENLGVNIFNIDLVYSWNFAPGSEINVVWKNFIETSDESVIAGTLAKEIAGDYFTNFGATVHSPATNSFSLKVIYYLDYQYLKRKKKLEESRNM